MEYKTSCRSKSKLHLLFSPLSAVCKWVRFWLSYSKGKTQTSVELQQGYAKMCALNAAMSHYLPGEAERVNLSGVLKT